MVETAGESRTAMSTEVERYCTWPGQACSYKVGHTRWLKLRAQAQRRLGAKFDIRDFHDVGLTAAPMPLSFLERVIEGWLKRLRACECSAVSPGAWAGNWGRLFWPRATPRRTFRPRRR